MLEFYVSRWAGLALLLSALACALVRQTPMPAAEVEQIAFEVQTATPTVGILVDAPTATHDPNITPTLLLTVTLEITETSALTASTDISATATILEAPEEAIASPEPDPAEAPEATPAPVPVVPPAEPLRGGVWDFEDGFAEWRNPYGDICPGSGLAVGWNAFTSQDQFGSSCMNQTVWKDNVYTGESAQEITFAYVGVQAGVFRSAPTTPGHRYTIEAHMRREFSPAKVDVFLGVDPTGGTDWQAESVQWFPWNEDLDNAWSRTEATVTASGENMTIFIKGSHPYPEPGGTLRLDSISVVDNGPELISE